MKPSRPRNREGENVGERAPAFETGTAGDAFRRRDARPRRGDRGRALRAARVAARHPADVHRGRGVPPPRVAGDRLSRRVRVFDTTLRDGEQAPGASLVGADKLRIAHALAELGVDIIEAGFAAASEGEHEAVSTIAREVRGPAIATLARAADRDIDEAARALSAAERSVLHVFIATSDVHLEKKLKIDRDECLSRVHRAVSRAVERAARVEFSAEDATRTDPAFLARVYGVAAKAGATSVNIPDTVGYVLPSEFAALMRSMRAVLPAHVAISVHCHNDLGLAVANTLSAVEAGVDQVHVTVNGLGERGGNASLEETVMALRMRRDHYDAETSVVSEGLVPISRLVSELTGIPVQPNKAIVGANAFAHASGVHQDGVLKDPRTYEIMTPESVGWEARRIVVGKLSGRRGLAARLVALGVPLDGDALERAYALAMRRGEEVHALDDHDLVTIAATARRTAPQPVA
ncbi:MAG: 2-isopropylmalate synthase [Chloroflexi bacterium]|nr:2-isopropylmalate synthase [Chloroflexota bacterium]